MSEDDLHAFVDEQLDAATRVGVERYLQENPEAAARVRDWAATRDNWRRGLLGKPTEPIPSRLNLDRLAETRLARGWSYRQVAASVVLALLIGGGSGWMLRGPDKPGGVAALTAQAVTVQRIFAKDAARSAPMEALDRAAISRLTEEQLGRPVAAPDLSRSGYRLLGGRLVATDAGPGCTLVYEDARGERLTVLVRAMNGRDVDFPLRAIADGDVRGFAWMGAGLAVGVVSGRSATDLRTLSEQVQSDTGTGA